MMTENLCESCLLITMLCKCILCVQLLERLACQSFNHSRLFLIEFNYELQEKLVLL